MSRVPQLGRASRLRPGLLAACLLAGWGAQAAPGACADPATVTAVLRLLAEQLGLAGPLTLEHIRRAAADPAVEGSVCEADVAGIRNAPAMFGRSLDRVQYRDGHPNAATTPVLDARLMPRAAEPMPAPALIDATRPTR